MKSYHNRPYKKVIKWAQLSLVERAFEKFKKAHNVKDGSASNKNRSMQLYNVWKELNNALDIRDERRIDI